MRKRLFVLTLFLALIASGGSVGCATGFVENAARESLASFVISIFDAAANEAINPQD
jgi:hypothetical protein